MLDDSYHNAEPLVRRLREQGLQDRGFTTDRSDGRCYKHMRKLLDGAWTSSGLSREGFLISKRHVHAIGLMSLWAMQTESDLMNVIDELQANYDAAAKLWDAYNERLHEFRSAVKNDVVSLEAAARKTADASVRINKSYADVFAQLNGDDMQRAIVNAERLARALEAVSNLSATKLTFAVFDSQAVNGAGKQMAP